MQAEKLENLIEKYLEDKATIEEINQLDEWYNSFDSHADLYVPDSTELKKVVAERFSDFKLHLATSKQFH
ncbi:MAG: hypothetical protein ABIS01_06020 [Ferruginibacter sp.]